MPGQFDFNDDLGGAPERRDEMADMEKMIFPLNVHESLKSSGGLKKSEKTGIIIAMWLLACGIIGWFLMSWLQSIMSHYILVTVIAELVLNLTVGVYLLRFILDEKAMFQEVEKRDLSFAQYFKIYRELRADDGSRLPFDVIEFNDGSYGAYIQLRLGFNTNVRSNNTFNSNHQFIETLNKAGLPHKTFYHNERFKASAAAEDLRQILNGIKDPKLFNSYRSLVQNYLAIADNESNVLCITHLIYAQTRIQKDEFVDTMNSLIAILERFETVYREITVLKYDDIVTFLQDYYKLDVLDMGLVRANIALTKRETAASSVHVLKLYSKSGKIYTNKEFKQLKAEILKQDGLEGVS